MFTSWWTPLIPQGDYYPKMIPGIQPRREILSNDGRLLPRGYSQFPSLHQHQEFEVAGLNGIVNDVKDFLDLVEGLNDQERLLLEYEIRKQQQIQSTVVIAGLVGIPLLVYLFAGKK